MKQPGSCDLLEQLLNSGFPMATDFSPVLGSSAFSGTPGSLASSGLTPCKLGPQRPLKWVPGPNNRDTSPLELITLQLSPLIQALLPDEMESIDLAAALSACSDEEQSGTEPASLDLPSASFDTLFSPSSSFDKATLTSPVSHHSRVHFNFRTKLHSKFSKLHTKFRSKFHLTPQTITEEVVLEPHPQNSFILQSTREFNSQSSELSHGESNGETINHGVGLSRANAINWHSKIWHAKV